MNKNFNISWNCKNGNYYISHNDDLDKWGLERERVIYHNRLGYFYKIGKREIYLTDEETKTLNSFRKEICT